jgi:hypothetical protein
MESTISPGTVFARLTVLKSAGRKNEHATSRCRCKCGNIVEHARNDKLLHGRTKSCGCLRAELTAQEILEGRLRKQIRRELCDELKASAKLLTLRKRELASLQAKLETVKRREARTKERRLQKEEGESVDILVPRFVPFNRDKLRKLIVAAESVPSPSKGICVVDYALTDNPRSDNTALLAARTAYIEGQKHYWITDVGCDKWDQRETAYQVQRFLGKHNPDRAFIERLSGYELLKAEILRQAEKYGTVIDGDIRFFKACKRADSKRNRILLFKQVCDEKRVHFVWGGWIDILFDSLCAYTGEKRNRGRKDDAADCAGYLALFEEPPVAGMGT